MSVLLLKMCLFFGSYPSCFVNAENFCRRMEGLKAQPWLRLLNFLEADDGVQETQAQELLPKALRNLVFRETTLWE